MANYYITVDGVPSCQSRETLNVYPPTKCGWADEGEAHLEARRIKASTEAESVVVHTGHCPGDDWENAALPKDEWLIKEIYGLLSAAASAASKLVAYTMENRSETDSSEAAELYGSILETLDKMQDKT